jgi:2-oxoglutarate/2-oxoacid ferredoxin oxidoreductase subunit beta
MPDGSVLRLFKIDRDYDPHDRVAALTHVQERQAEGEVVTGLLYVDPEASDCHEILDTVHRPLNALGEAELCPGDGALGPINASFR